MSNSTKNFVIVGTQRTGTTLIRTSISSHPDILCIGEAFKFGKKPYREPGGLWHYTNQTFMRRIRALAIPSHNARDYLNALYSNRNYAAVGFKLMLSQCRLYPFILPILEAQQAKVILVRRKNTLKTLISRQAAAQTGVYHVSDSWDAPRLRVDTEKLLPELELVDQEHSDWINRLHGKFDYIELVYEDYRARSDEKNREILDFLQVSQQPLSTELRKVNPDNLAQLISNYEDVVSTLKNTKYAEHLDLHISD